MKIQIKGPIISDADQWVYDWFGIPATSPGKVASAIQNAQRNDVKELTVAINSGGGSVFDASEIYTDLKRFPGAVTTEIVGMAASAASVIAMAGSTVTMTPTGQLMIHNASTSSWGDYREMDHTSDFLQKVNKSIMNAYAAQTGTSEEELKGLMDAETWMTAQEAKEQGFIDSIMFENELGATANADYPQTVEGVLPREVIDKVREQLANDKSRLAVNAAPAEWKNGGDKMDIEIIKAEHPALYEEIFNLGKTDGISAERTRIQEIEDIAFSGNEDIVNRAKFETGASAAETSLEIVKAQKSKNTERLQAVRNDAEKLGTVTPTAESTPSAGENVEQFAANLLNSMGIGGK